MHGTLSFWTETEYAGEAHMFMATMCTPGGAGRKRCHLSSFIITIHCRGLSFLLCFCSSPSICNQSGPNHPSHTSMAWQQGLQLSANPNDLVTGILKDRSLDRLCCFVRSDGLGSPCFFHAMPILMPIVVSGTRFSRYASAEATR